MPGASWLQVSQSMQVESTKKSPGTFSGKRCCRLAMLVRHRSHRARLNVKFVDQPVQVGTADAEFFGGSDFVAFALKGVHDHSLLQHFDRAFECRLVACFC